VNDFPNDVIADQQIYFNPVPEMIQASCFHRTFA
jgi:hypothetical protein